MQPYLRIPELDQTRLIHHYLVPVVLARSEQFRQREPLPGHLIPVVGVHELVVVDAVGRVPLHALDGRLAAVERDDVVDEALPRGGELDRLRWVRRVVIRGGGLAGLVLLPRGLGVHGAGGDGVGRHVGS